MKSRNLFPVLVAVLNLYMLGAWTYAYNKYPIHLIRVTAFRRFFGDLNLDIINLAILVLTIISLVFVLKLTQKSLRYSILLIHMVTLAFIIWMNL